MSSVRGADLQEGGPALPRLIFGTLSLERLEPSAGIRLLHAALDRGLTALDTAPLYGRGGVEQLVGAAIRDRRSRVQLATKCGIRWDHEHGTPLFEAEVGGARRTFRANGLPQSIRQEVEASLTRLGVEAIDVIQLHQFDALVPLEDTLGELMALQREGKVKALGVSNFPVDALERTLSFLTASGAGVQSFSTQDEYNALEQRAQPLLALVRARGARFWAYSPLAGGVLSGRYLEGAPGQTPALPTDHRKDAAVFVPDNLARINAALRAVAVPIARAHGVSVSELGLAWVLSQPGVSAAIIGASSEQQLDSNVRALQASFSPAEIGEFGCAMRDAAPRERASSLMARVKAKARRAFMKVSR